MTILLLAAAAAAPEWQLVWADEFDGAALDRNRWVLAEDCWGGGNEERQCYTARPQNHRVKDGVLEIVAQREDFTGPAFPRDQRDNPQKAVATREKPFTSARLSTQGKASWLYGKVQIRARLPQGQGTWPAIWMLPEDWAYGGWARSGEIDIMEAVNLGQPCEACEGGQENRVLGTIHFGGEPPRNRYITEETQLADPTAFHTYEVEWDKDSMVWRVDGKDYARRAPHEWHTLASDKAGAPFDKPFHLILNLAIGGHLPEGRNAKGVDPSGFPKAMAVDWVRVWQKPPVADNALKGTKSGGN
ncbi:glycoside hydrolase family 16 protein [Novosphingobium taihuense]|uniref:Beta-glucanase (GH16 family) n=1 Tax=Novosphingobium taihuense TaxID=260085 RepID=A0A7W7A8E5_9SPHN|nr:glycoside hydrolase family 16 protein [Novosphingobium taihuense]MBB4612325.1 beta-glucanase (GH16 family) [Novosphingobium taihuense]TWH88322.1 glycosyl hydrolase family 16 [Novosphingobium taihuense]